MKTLFENPIVVTVLADGYTQMTPPTVDDAKKWKAAHPKQPGIILYDNALEFANPAAYDFWEVGRRTPGQIGFPFSFYVHMSNMRVWDTFEGFPDGFLNQYKPWWKQELEILTYCSTQPFAIEK